MTPPPEVYSYCPDCFGEQGRSSPSKYIPFPCARHAYAFAEVILKDKIAKLVAERDEARTLLTAALARVTKLEAEKRNLEQFAHMVKGLPACQEYARAYGITGEAL